MQERERVANKPESPEPEELQPTPDDTPTSVLRATPHTAEVKEREVKKEVVQEEIPREEVAREEENVTVGNNARQEEIVREEDVKEETKNLPDVTLVGEAKEGKEEVSEIGF